MICFCGIIDQQKVLNLISRWEHCQRSPPLLIFNPPQARFEPAQSLISSFVEWSCAVMITTKLRETSIILKKPGFLFEKLKTLTSSNYHRIQLFLLKFCTHFLLNNVYKSMFGICFMFRSWVINKNIKNKCAETRSL